jgi:hypothetical protein
MATLTEMVAAVVVHSSAMAFSHFGVTIDGIAAEKPHAADERVVARSPRQVFRDAAVERASTCPTKTAAQLLKA